MIAQVGLAAIAAVILYAIIWQTLRAILPIRMDATSTRFKGIYRKYSVRVTAGYVEGHRQTWRARQFGNVTASYNDLTNMATVRDTRSRVHQYKDHFVLDDRHGHAVEVAAVDVRPSLLLDGHLVSVATLSKGSKPGNSFLVFNHSTDLWWLERRGDMVYKNGFVWMSNRFTMPRMIFLILLVVTIPWLLVTAWLWQFQYNRFKKKGVQPVLTAMRAEAARFSAAAPVSAVAGLAAVPADTAPGFEPDLVSQMTQLTNLHASGALNDQEFQAAKAKLLSVPGAVREALVAPVDSGAANSTVGWHPDALDPTVTRYWDGTNWAREMRWDGSKWD